MALEVVFINHATMREQGDKLMELLAHKPQLAKWFLEEMWKEAEDGLRCEGMITRDGDTWLGNIQLFHAFGVGLVGNAYLKEEFRGRGWGARMMEGLAELARREHHHCHLLWVDPQKKQAAYGLYRKFSFIPREGTGTMVRDFSGKDIFKATGTLKARPLAWKDYPVIDLLTSLGNCDVLVSYLYHCYGTATFEGEYVKFMADPDTKGWAVIREDGLPVGCFFIRRDPQWEQQLEAHYENRNYLFDYIIDVRHGDAFRELIREFTFPEGRYTAYATTPGPKVKALEGVFSMPLSDIGFATLVLRARITVRREQPHRMPISVCVRDGHCSRAALIATWSSAARFCIASMPRSDFRFCQSLKPCTSM